MDEAFSNHNSTTPLFFPPHKNLPARVNDRDPVTTHKSQARSRYLHFPFDWLEQRGESPTGRMCVDPLWGLMWGPVREISLEGQRWWEKAGPEAGILFSQAEQQKPASKRKANDEIQAPTCCRRENYSQLADTIALISCRSYAAFYHFHLNIKGKGAIFRNSCSLQS